MRAETRVEVLTPADWRAWRDLRCEGLADTPIGFGELYADALLRTDDDWQASMRRPGIRVMAFEDAEPLGLAGGFHNDEAVPVLFGVYVRPTARGRGVLGELVSVVSSWAAPDPLTLDVHEDNHRAHAAYNKLGFVDTGQLSVGGGIDGRDLVHMRASG